MPEFGWAGLQCASALHDFGPHIENIHLFPLVFWKTLGLFVTRWVCESVAHGSSSSSLPAAACSGQTGLKGYGAEGQPLRRGDRPGRRRLRFCGAKHGGTLLPKRMASGTQGIRAAKPFFLEVRRFVSHVRACVSPDRRVGWRVSGGVGPIARPSPGNSCFLRCGCALFGFVCA